jgi:hypothetical protein
MASNYNITFLHGFMEPDGGPSFSIDGGIPGKLVLTKERCFEDANTDTMPVLLKDGRSKAKCDADRAYLHYIIDCWLDDKSVELDASDMTPPEKGEKLND